jgi:hypothetical protein
LPVAFILGSTIVIVPPVTVPVEAVKLRIAVPAATLDPETPAAFPSTIISPPD